LLLTQDELDWPNLSTKFNSSELSGKRKCKYLESKESKSDAEQVPNPKVSSISQTTEKVVKSGKQCCRQKADTGSACDLNRETDEDGEQVVTSTSS
jgi:hypothetical protein